MKISVVTLSFNQVEFLSSAIDSVLSQKGAEIEYIIVDAGSTDGSIDVIDRYRDRIDHVLIGPDRGPADGLNRGFAVATGDVFYYLNADDLVKPGAFATALAHFGQDPNLAVLHGSIEIIDRDGDRIRRFYSPTFSLKKFAFGAQVLPQQATFFKKSIFNDGIKFNIENRSCWDGEFILECGLAGAKFKRIPDFLGDFRVYGESITGSGRFAEAYKADHDRMFERVFGRSRTRRDMKLTRLLKIQRWVCSPRATLASATDQTRFAVRSRTTRTLETRFHA